MDRPISNPSDGDTGRRGDAAAVRRRTVLSAISATAGTIGIGSISGVGAGTRDPDVVPGFSCADRQFTCGRQVTASDGMVSSVDPIASGVAASVLREGGNAVDAAVALQYVLTVTQPHSSGIGGGGFMVIYDADADEVTVVNSRERAPRGASEDMFLDGGEPIPFDERIQLGQAVGIPGTVMGLETARELHGSRPRRRLIRPAVHLARKGFPVDGVFAEQIAENWEKLNDAARDAYSNRRGEPLEAGDTHVNPDLADALERIERGGAAAFYEGPIADDIAATVQAAGGSMTPSDLAEYDVTLDEPVRTEWRDVEIVGQPLPSSGPSTVAYILRLLEFLEIEEYGLRSPEKYHLLGEATSLAWADRNEYMGDPEFVDVPIEGLLSDEYLADRAGRVRVGETLADYEADECIDPGVPPGAGASQERSATEQEYGSTTHFSVVDGNGNAVSYTSTIEQLMGSGLMVPGRGFLLNNELTDFDAEPGGPNQVEPWKRPLSSMSPTMVFRDGTPECTVGSPGGWTIITSVAQTLLHRYVYGLEPLEALTEPTVFTTECPPIMWEDGVPADARAATASFGQVWEDESSGDFGNVQVIEIGEDELIGAADPTRDGLAVGFDRGGTRDHDRTGKRGEKRTANRGRGD